MSQPRRRRRSSLLGLLLAAALLVAGCTAGGASEASGGGGGGGEAAPAAAGPDVAQATAGDRQVVTTGDATVEVEDPAAAVPQVTALVEGVGGRVDERFQQADGEGGEASASLTVRVPAGEVTEVLEALEGVGEVGTVSLASADVTGQVRDLDARISALQASTRRLEALIGDAATTADLLAAEQALADRQGTLESLLAERAALGEQVDLSTLRIQLVGSGAAPVPGPDGFLDGLALGWSSLLGALAGALVVAGVLAPWLLVGVVLAAALLGVRRLVRRRRQRPAQPAGA